MAEAPIKVDTAAMDIDPLPSPSRGKAPATTVATPISVTDSENQSGNGNGTEAKTKPPTDSVKKKNKKTEVPYTQLVEKAIVAMKDRSGSSNVAIKKWIIDNRKQPSICLSAFYIFHV